MDQEKMSPISSSELFEYLRGDLRDLRSDVKDIKKDVAILLSFKTKVGVAVLLGTGIMSMAWAVLIRLVH